MHNIMLLLIGIRESVTQGKSVNPEHIIPSVYLKSMSDLYSNMQYENVVRLAKLALRNSENTDTKILHEIQYSLCSALAKLKDPDFMTEVQKLDYDAKKFWVFVFFGGIAFVNPQMSKYPLFFFRWFSFLKSVGF